MDQEGPQEIHYSPSQYGGKRETSLRGESSILMTNSQNESGLKRSTRRSSMNFRVRAAGSKRGDKDDVSGILTP